MITLEINNERHDLSDINSGWINEQIRKRQDDGVPVCLRIYVKQSNIDVVLSCGECSADGGGGRRANHDEEKIFSLWEKFGCKDSPLNPGKIIAFLNQIK